MPKARRQPTIYAEQNAVQRLSDAREARAIPIRRLAEMLTEAGCPMHASAVSDTLNGSRRLSVDELVAFARVLDISLSQLVNPKAYAEKELERLHAQAQFEVALQEFATENLQRANERYTRAVSRQHEFWAQHPEARAPLTEDDGLVARDAREIDVYKTHLKRAIDDAVARLQP